MPERRAPVDPADERLDVARSGVYRVKVPVAADDLALMRRMGRNLTTSLSRNAHQAWMWIPALLNFEWVTGARYSLSV